MTPAESTNDLEPSQKLQQRWLEVALIVAVCFVHAGDPPPQTNESHYLPKAKHYWQPEWCQGDLFLESADAHVVFYWTVGWLTQFCSLSTVAWIGRFAAWTAFAWSWQRLSYRILEKRFCSVLSAALFLWLTTSMNFAGEWVVGGVEGKCFAYACVFVGLAAMADGNWNRVWPWFGLGGAFHVLVGGWSAILAGLVWLTESRTRRPSLVAMLPSMLFALLLALPGIVPALQLTAGATSAQSAEAARIYVFERLKHHLAPFHESAYYVLGRTLRFSVPLLTFLLLWQAARAQSDKDDQKHIALERICRFGAWSFLVCVVGLTWEMVFWNRPEWAAPVLRYYWFRLTDVGVSLAAVFLVCYWLERLFARKSKLAPVVLSGALALVVWYFGGASFARWSFPISPAEKNLGAVAGWHDTCDWIRQNTPEDALILAPRMSQSLSWHAGRKNLVTWKDVPQDAESLIAWFDRYRDVFFYEDPNGVVLPHSSLGIQGTKRIRQLADKYEIDYVVAREYPPLDFPLVYGNAWFAVYDVAPHSQD